jgi:selenocysteine lyase/cysteine desulfurase
VAQGFPFRAGDNVVLSDVEYPAAVYPWLNLESKGVRIRWIRTRQRDGLVHMEDVQRAVNERTRLVCMSLVSFWSGQRLPFRAIGNWCGERGIYFVADGTQALGQVSVDVRRDGIDALAVEGRKWLFAPEGVGFWYCSPELLDRLNVSYVGAAAVRNSDQYLEYRLEWKEGASRFEPGALNVPGILGLGRALHLFREWGMDRVETRIRLLTGIAGDVLAGLGRNRTFPMIPEYESGIVCFEPAGETEALRKRLDDAGIRMGVGPSRCSISAHFYNTEDEIRRALMTTSAFWERPSPHEQG